VVPYRSRLIDARIDRKLRTSGGVLVRGARQVGKTTTALQHVASHVRLDEPNSRRLAQLEPSAVLGGATPRLVDEWQLVPEIWNAIRHEIDTRSAKGQFILTGSAAPYDDVTRHSGAGRIARMTLRPMALSESGDSTEAVQFASLWQEWDTGALGGPTVADYAGLIVRGGWPGLVDLPAVDASDALSDYVDNLSSVDLRTLESPPDPIRVAALLTALARNTSTEASLTKLAAEAQIDGAEISSQTVRKYLDQLTQVHILDEVAAWPVHLRSSIARRVKPKWHFVDPSLATAVLRVAPDSLLKDLEAFGLLFESLAIRDLRAYADTMEARVFHYRDSEGLEIDTIIERPDGAWVACEIKLGGEASIDQAALNLARLRDRLTAEKWSRLVSLNVITAGKVSYRRQDGIQVVALGHLTANPN
jgi:predicted AAA+ superfamily ATPase